MTGEKNIEQDGVKTEPYIHGIEQPSHRYSCSDKRDVRKWRLCSPPSLDPASLSVFDRDELCVIDKIG